MALFIGIDVGTSGCRAMVIDASRRIVAESHKALPAPVREGERCTQDPMTWWYCLQEALDELCTVVNGSRITAISLDATSSTLLLTDISGRPLGPALMYNDCSCHTEASRIESIAPPDSIARGASSSLSKLLFLHKQYPTAARALHQADWLLGCLGGRFDTSDENNALKLGYDLIARRWPDWINQLGLPGTLFPRVLKPGQAYSTLDQDLAQRWGMSPETLIVAGTTDSTAAFLATGASAIGDAVTSLGSSMVLKVISEQPVFAPRYGVYSHRIGDLWLAGGASNTGGATLLQYFSPDEMNTMSPLLDPDHPTGIDMYPLPATGERFPVNDPGMRPRIPEFPVDNPEQKLRFFQGMLESIARIECEGYRLLEQLGAPFPKSVRSVGGGSHNPAWTSIRGKALAVPMLEVEHPDAAYGAALLAMKGHQEMGTV